VTALVEQAPAIDAGSATTVPWRVGDLTVMAGANLVGLIGILAAWFGGAGTVDVASQLAWLRLGVGAVVVAGLGNGLWMLAGMRAVGARRRQVLSRAPRTAVVPTAVAETVHPTAANPPHTALVSGPRMTRYHRPDCPAASDRPVEPASLTSHLRAGRTACGICRPEACPVPGGTADG
jgi:hypothetical protein